MQTNKTVTKVTKVTKMPKVVVRLRRIDFNLKDGAQRLINFRSLHILDHFLFYPDWDSTISN